MNITKYPPPEKAMTRSVVSRFRGWLSINESQNLTRSTAPEILNVPLTAQQT